MGRLPPHPTRRQEVAAIGRRAGGGPAAWLTLAGIALAVAGLAWPVTASADHGGDRHDQCQAAPGAGYYGEPGDDCAPPAAPPPTGSPPLPTPAATAPIATAVPTPRPVPRPVTSPDAVDLRTSLLGAAALAALAALVVSGFAARRRLRHGWDDAGPG